MNKAQNYGIMFGNTKSIKYIWGEIMRKIIVTILVILAGTCPVNASTITFSSGHYIWTDTDPYYDEVFVVNEAILDFTGGGIGKLEGFHNALINITGGTMDQLWAGDEVIANIYECMDLDILEASENSIMNLYTNDFIYSSTGGTMEQGYIEGFYYGTTTDFFISFYDDTTYSHINIVPEPTTFLLLALSSLALLRKRRIE